MSRLRLAGFNFKGAPGDTLSDKDKSSFFMAVANGLFEKMSAPPEGFDTCGSLPKVPDCRACCLALPGATNKSCGKACGQAHAGHASPSEPTP